MWILSGFADEISPDLHSQCETLNGLGIEYIEFRSAWDTNVLDLDDDQLDAASKILAARGIRTSSIGSPIGKIPITEDFEPHLARFSRALHVAAVLGAPYIRLFSFFMPAGDDPARHRDEVLRRMTALTTAAKGHDVILLHENEKEIYGDSPARCLDIVESVGSQQLHLIWDAANFVQCGVRPFTDGYALLRPYLDYVHVKDAVMASGEVVPSGAGDGELVLTVRAMKADGFEGFFSMEPHLAVAGTMGGFSGADLFTQATRTFTRLLDANGVTYR
jgi:sugar phosphate isomerase/epimerase